MTLGYYIAKRDQTQVWADDFRFIARDLRQRGLGQFGNNWSLSVIDGIWDYDNSVLVSRQYIESHLQAHLPGSCGGQ